MAILMMICSAIMILVHYHIVTICLIILTLYHACKSDARTMARSIFAFFISMILILGIPSGIIKAIYKDDIAGTDIELELIKEVGSWMP